MTVRHMVLGDCKSACAHVFRFILGEYGMRMRRSIGGSFVLLLILGIASTGRASPLIGSSFDGTIYDVDPETGLATNPRGTGIHQLVGLAFSLDGLLYGYDTVGSLFTIDPSTGFSTVAGTGPGLAARYDVAFDPDTGDLWASRPTPGPSSGGTFLTTLTIDGGLVVDTFVGALRSSSPALAFNGAGGLFALDNTQGRHSLLEIDKTPPTPPWIQMQLLTETPLTAEIADLATLAIDPSWHFYISGDDLDGNDTLYAFDTNDAAVTVLGPTGVADGLTSLTVVPEPATLLLVGLGAVCCARGARSRIKRTGTHLVRCKARGGTDR